jgi:hypothetical protein
LARRDKRERRSFREGTHMSTAVDAVYYPWIAMSDLETLKKALVYFDRVYLVCPPTIARFKGWFREREDVHGRWNQQEIQEFENRLVLFFEFQDNTRELVSEGVLQFVDPYEFGVPCLAQKVNTWSSKNVTDAGAEHVDSVSASSGDFADSCRLLTNAILSDFKEAGFCNLPTSLKAFIGMGWMFDYGASGTTLSEFYGYNLREVMIGQGTAVPETLHLDLSHFPHRGRDRWSDHLGIAVESYVAQSLIINRTLMVAAEMNAAPFTDQMDHFAFMEEKFARISKKGPSPDAIQRCFPECDFREHAFGSRIVETQLPNMEGFGWKDILTIREKVAPELERFRVEVAALATDISAGETGDLQSQIETLIRKKITPAVSELESALKLSRVKVLKTAFAKAQSLKPLVPFSVSVLAGIPIEVGLLISAGMLGLDTALDSYLQRKEIRASSGLSYLLNYR